MFSMYVFVFRAYSVKRRGKVTQLMSMIKNDCKTTVSRIQRIDGTISFVNNKRDRLGRKNVNLLGVKSNFMFKKVLIVEDHEIVNISIQRTLAEVGIQNVKYVYYCDDALTWVSRALQDDEPYDLLVTDLSFEEDHNTQHITTGMELIKAIKAIQPTIKVLVFSGESRTSVIDHLFSKYGINAYVRKARRDAQHLKEAFVRINEDTPYTSVDIKRSINGTNSFEFTSVDVEILKLLAAGILQKEIPEHLRLKDIRPSSLSSIEKRLNTMRDVFDFNKNEQLVAYCKDKGVL